MSRIDICTKYAYVAVLKVLNTPPILNLRPISYNSETLPNLPVKGSKKTIRIK